MALLKINNLKKFFPAGKESLFGESLFAHAVDGVSLTLKNNETLGIVGESGCGKSTLGRTILKLLSPTDGEIIFKGDNITEYSNKLMSPLRKKMQMIFQDPYASLNPRMSVARIISEPLKVHQIAASKNEINETVDELLDMVGMLPSSKKRFPNEFSGGQRQRIMIARVLATQPELVVADEAVSALDVSIQSQILNLISELKEKFGMAYIFISHDLSVVKFISDRIAVMYLGAIVENADSNELYQNPLHPYTKSLLSAIPGIKKRTGRKRVILKGDVPSLVNLPSGCRFHTRCPEVLPICREVAPSNIKVSGDHNVCCHLYK